MRPLLRFATVVTAAASIVGGTACKAPLPNEGPMPELTGAATWFNSTPLSNADLRGKVVLIDFWTYSCVNCLRVIPYVKAWDAKYRDQGLVVIGVHAPEFDFEEDTTNVKAAIERLGIQYPVVLDNDMAIWNAFHNKFWPAHYFIDVNGQIRYHHFGEGEYAKSEEVIRTLLKDVKHPEGSLTRNPAKLRSDTAMHIVAGGMGEAAQATKGRSPETYVGYLRAARFASQPAMARDTFQNYAAPSTLDTHAWALDGQWRVAREYGETGAAGAAITYRYHGRDVNLVLGPAIRGTRLRFRVTIDGKAPGADAGLDVDADGYGEITENRMYQLVRHKSGPHTGTFVITFESPGARAYAFTFG